MTASSPDCEILIVGAGVYGLGIALSLARGEYQGKASRILVIDRSATPPEEDAASNDINKIIRGDYCDSTYAQLAEDALLKWKNDPEFSPYFVQSGIVVAASSLGSHGEYYVNSSYNEQKRLFEAGKSATPSHSITDSTSFSSAMRAGNNRIGTHPPLAYRNDSSGWGKARDSMQALAQRCREAGVSFTQGQVDRLVIENGDVVGAETKDGRVVRASRRVVLAAGSWSPAILPELSDKLTATGQVLATIHLDPSEAAKWRDIPVYIDMESGFYMFPPTEENKIKIAFHLRGYTNEQASLSDSERTVSVPRTGHFVGDLDENIPKKSVDQLRESLRKVWPELAEKPFMSTRMCWYCDSNDCDFLIGYHPKYPSLFLATGDSGHAYKFLPIIGDLCVQAMVGKLPPHIAKAWSPSRERKDHKPDRGTSVLIPLDISQLASGTDLQAARA